MPKKEKKKKAKKAGATPTEKQFGNVRSRTG